MTSSKSLFYICVSFVVGIALESLIKIPQFFIWVFLVLGTFFIAASFLKKEAAISGFCILVLVLGILRFQISEFNITNDRLIKFNDKPEKVILVGQIVDEPDLRNTYQKLKVKIADSLVLITINRYPEYDYLDTIKIMGKLKTPVIFEDFNYKNYLMKDGIYSVMDFPKTELISSKHLYNMLTFLYEKILLVKAKLMTSITTNFLSPQDSILQGIVFGNDKNMAKDLKNKFNATGLSHLTAVSGSNIVILISILTVFLLALGFWRGQAFYFAVIFIWLYIILIGFPISGIRAAIMGCIALLAQKLGRQNTSSRVLVIAAALMLLQNPLLLFYDISFQLSFLASMGIIYLKPLIDNLLGAASKNMHNILSLPVGKRKINSSFSLLIKSKSKFLLDIISITLAAQIFTLPIIVYNFGTMSLIAPITNLLIVPIIYWLMIFGFSAAVFGIFSNFLGWVFSLPCWLMITYLLKVIDIFYQPWAVKSIQNVSWIWPALYYIILFVTVKFLQKYQKPKFLGY